MLSHPQKRIHLLTQSTLPTLSGGHNHSNVRVVAKREEVAEIPNSGLFFIF